MKSPGKLAALEQILLLTESDNKVTRPHVAGSALQLWSIS